MWRCHIGVDTAGPLARAAWNFLRGDVDAASLCVFSRADYVWQDLKPPTVVMAPCIDVLLVKNRPLDPGERDAILDASGIVSSGASRRSVNGSNGTVTHRASKVEDEPVPSESPIVMQVSRWDRLKDPAGLLRAFSSDANAETLGAHLVVAGPQVQAIADDPEDAAVFAQVPRTWSALPLNARRRTHLICLPADNLEETH